MYTVIFSPKALKALKRIPKEYQSRIRNLSAGLSKDPFKHDLKKLSGEFDATHRLRVGSYRLFLVISKSKKLVGIADIRRRTTQTYN